MPAVPWLVEGQPSKKVFVTAPDAASSAVPAAVAGLDSALTGFASPPRPGSRPSSGSAVGGTWSSSSSRLRPWCRPWATSVAVWGPPSSAVVAGEPGAMNAILALMINDRE